LEYSLGFERFRVQGKRLGRQLDLKMVSHLGMPKETDSVDLTALSKEDRKGPHWDVSTVVL